MKLILALLLLFLSVVIIKPFFTAQTFHGTQLTPARATASFNLIGIDGKPFDNHSLMGQWTLIFFGFTRCNTVCPTTMSELARLYRQLEHLHTKPLPRIVLISLDPTHDTLTELTRFVSAFNPHFYAATGTEQAIATFSQSLGIAYSLNHSATLILFNPAGKIIAYFTAPHQAAVLANDYRFLLNQPSSERN